MTLASIGQHFQTPLKPLGQTGTSYGESLGWGNTNVVKWSWSDGHHIDLW